MKKISFMLAVGLLAITFTLRLLYASPFAATWDEVDFSLALDRYDLAMMQPHFPGYPFFIFMGMLIHTWIDNPSEALAIGNTILLITATVPIYLICRQRVSKELAIWITVVLQTGSYLSVLATQAMSEGTALAILWWYIWSLYIARAKAAFWCQVIPLFLFAILMGIRVSYIPFGAGLFWLWHTDWKRRGAKVLFLVVLAGLMQFIWIGALVWNTGGLDGFLKLAFGFVSGHFTEWGGAATATNDPIFHRIANLVWTNIVWTGLFAHSFLVAGAFILLLLVVIWKWQSLHFKQEALIFLLFSAYFIWNLLAQNIDKPRHSYPLVLLLLLLILRASPRVTVVPLIVIALLQTSVGGMLVREQATSLPATYQLALYIQGEATVYTWEETRVMEYLQVPYTHKRVQQYAYFLQDKKYREHDTIYVTNHLLSGFQTQGIQPQVERVKTFRSNPLFDPIYSDITLYRLDEK
ncbi:hypothetical protein [Ectobacillus antri]|uniref:hypothetical protein n=1 Tax=Ectobacillus antri TaxID=2486280 RepID=UPI000F597F01|nr:hypothetical protein [Ectobacillus antri]